MDQAAANGHLEVVKWLYENRTEGIYGGGILLARKKGYKDVVDFFYNIKHFSPYTNWYAKWS
jgi:hypothetical protein